MWRQQKIKLFLDIDIPINKVPEEFKKKKEKYLIHEERKEEIEDEIKESENDINENKKENPKMEYDQSLFDVIAALNP